MVIKVVRRFRRPAAQAPIDLVARSTEGQRWGEPGACPACGAGGYLDRIDLVQRDLYQHCPSCGLHWITAEHELAGAPPADQRA